MSVRIETTGADGGVKRLPGSPDGSVGRMWSKDEVTALGGPERLMLSLIDVGLQAAALRRAAQLVVALDVAAREQAIVNQSRGSDAIR
jgi:hypothetical protein